MTRIKIDNNGHDFECGAKIYKRTIQIFTIFKYLHI